MEKKLIERNAHKLWALTADLGQEAARAGEFGKGYAEVYFELSRYVDALFDADEAQAAELAEKINIVMLNLYAEIVRAEDVAPGRNKALPPICSAVVKIAAEMSQKPKKERVIPEAAEPSVVAGGAEIVQFSFGGVLLCELLKNIGDFFAVEKGTVKDGKFSIRGEALDVIEPKGADKNENRLGFTVMKSDGKPVAVVMDKQEFDCTFVPHAGRAVSAEQGHPYADCARECWNAVGGGQFVFVDWQKFSVTAR